MKLVASIMEASWVLEDVKSKEDTRTDCTTRSAETETGGTLAMLKSADLFMRYLKAVLCVDIKVNAKVCTICSFPITFHLFRVVTLLRLHLGLTGLWNTKNKDDHILSLEPYVTNGSVLVRNDWERAYPDLVNELVGWRPGQKNSFDDGVDAPEILTFSLFDNIHIAGRQTVPIAPIRLDRPSPWVAPRE